MAKSVEVRFNQACEALKKANKFKTFEEQLKPQKEKLGLVPIEVQLNLAETVLKDAGVVRESRPVRKNNGAGDTYVEGNPFGPTVEEWTESANNFSPGYMKETTNPCQKGDKIMADWMLTNGKITEAQHRKLTGQPPAGYVELSEQQRKEFDFAKMCGISEADCFKLAKMGSTFKEVSRR